MSYNYKTGRTLPTDYFERPIKANTRRKPTDILPSSSTPTKVNGERAVNSRNRCRQTDSSEPLRSNSRAKRIDYIDRRVKSDNRSPITDDGIKLNSRSPTTTYGERYIKANNTRSPSIASGERCIKPTPCSATTNCREKSNNFTEYSKKSSKPTNYSERSINLTDHGERSIEPKDYVGRFISRSRRLSPEYCETINPDYCEKPNSTPTDYSGNPTEKPNKFAASSLVTDSYEPVRSSSSYSAPNYCEILSGPPSAPTNYCERPNTSPSCSPSTTNYCKRPNSPPTDDFGRPKSSYLGNLRKLVEIWDRDTNSEASFWASRNRNRQRKTMDNSETPIRVRDRNHVVPAPSDRPVGLDLEEFLPTNLRSPGYDDRMKDMSEDEAIEGIIKDHESTMAVLMSRARALRVVHEQFRSAESKVAMEKVMNSSDLCSIHDVLKVLMHRATFWSLDMCVIILPKVHELLQSRFELHISTGCEAIQKTLKNFSSVIKTNMLAPVGSFSVDIPREERYNKCKKCYETLMQIRTSLKSRHLPGDLGKTITELQKDLERLCID